MENMKFWRAVEEVPKNAQKEIRAGRLKGMTDINPMWRIKVLTEHFGMCGIGWKAPIIEKWIDEGANGVNVVNVICELSIKVDGEWSEPIQGIGGSCFVAKENAGLYTSDEAYKMAYTDALSVACKMLGVGANVYWAGGRSKYSAVPKETKSAEEMLKDMVEMPTDYRQEFISLCDKKGINATNYAELHGITKKTTQEEFKVICEEIKNGIIS